MSPNELITAVAHATGEPRRTIRQRGFTLLVPPNDPGIDDDIGRPPLVVNWDRLDAARGAIGLSPRRQGSKSR